MIIVSVIVTHNTRLQCLLDFIRFETTPKIRFMNCVVFKLIITNDELVLSMIYKGELDEHEQRKISLQRPYYVDKEDEGLIQWIRVNPPVSKPVGSETTLEEDDIWVGPNSPPNVKQMNIKPLNIYTPYRSTTFKDRLKLPANISGTYVFYLVRHGQGVHNATNTYGMTLDAPLTALGRQQAERAAIALKQDIKLNYANILPQQYYFFASDLFRSQITCETILTILFPDPRIYNKQIIILPCSHEITTKGNNKGNCDQVASESSLYKKVARENYSSCTFTDGRLNPLCKRSDVNWGSYLKFYGNKIRGEQNYPSGYVRSFFQTPTETKHCRNTNMISEAMEILQSRRRGGKITKKQKKRNTKKLKHF